VSDAGRRRAGVVTAFDSATGLGTIRGADDADHAFHCVEIADGTREIAVGTAVTFEMLPKFGRYEAGNVTP